MKPIYVKILLLALPALIYTQLISPLYSGGGQVYIFNSNITSSKELIPQYEAATKQATDIVAKAGEIKKSYDSFDTETKKTLNIIIPQEVNEIMIQDEITEFTKQSSLRIEKFSISKSSRSQFLELGEYEGSIEVTGNFENFKEMITYIERSLRIFIIESVEFSFSDKESDLGKPSIMKVSFKSYYLK